MIYNEIGSGGALTTGFVLQDVLRPVRTKFVPGEAVYNVAKARRGILERMVIKSVRSVTNRRTRGANRVLYVDQSNRLWNQWDLVLPAEAQAIVAAYAQRLLGDVESVLENC